MFPIMQLLGFEKSLYLVGYCIIGVITKIGGHFICASEY